MKIFGDLEVGVEIRMLLLLLLCLFQCAVYEDSDNSLPPCSLSPRQHLYRISMVTGSVEVLGWWIGSWSVLYVENPTCPVGISVYIPAELIVGVTLSQRFFLSTRRRFF